MRKVDCTEKNDKKREKSVLEITIIILLLCLLFVFVVSGGALFLKEKGIIGTPKDKNKTEDIIPTVIPENIPAADVSSEKIEDYKIADAADGDDLNFNTGYSSEEYNTFTGYGAVWVSKDQPTVPFVNDASNTSYAKYSIYDGDKLIYETDLIAPGKHLDWDAYKDLKAAGTYKLTQKCQFFSPVIKDGKRTGFIEDGVAISNPEFVITVK